ncbi:MAG: DUF1611 domain-containing protein [Acidobacteria bacterium]|nr:MAG: DUF1611 domain-containing protein [Acidobacteriota bacterium]REK04261.1 MAG: DUF1611 domain-containing protein [Acidobacteriota bacterium]
MRDALRTPYLLFLGDARDPLDIKTARGVHHWRPDLCVGQLRLSADAESLGLPDLTPEEAAERGARTLVLGTVSPGGTLPDAWIDALCAAARAGLDVANGLHRRLTSIPELADAAREAGVRLVDLRDPGPPPPVGKGTRREGVRVLTVGTDCNLGKMYTALALTEGLRQRGVDARFRATGQTGILIAGDGAPVDAVVSDFISGTVEQLTPATAADVWQIVEGQGSLHHPAYAGVSLGLLHGAQPDYLVICHEPTRAHMRHAPGFPLPSLDETMVSNLSHARLTNPEVRCAGFSINTSKLDDQRAATLLEDTRAAFALPACDPVRFGISALVDKLLELHAERRMEPTAT